MSGSTSTPTKMALSVSSLGSNGVQLLRDYDYPDMATTFSILSRIEWSATSTALARRILRRGTFSILSRIEWSATSRGSDFYAELLQLSVSSLGSNGVQP